MKEGRFEDVVEVLLLPGLSNEILDLGDGMAVVQLEVPQLGFSLQLRLLTHVRVLTQSRASYVMILLGLELVDDPGDLLIVGFVFLQVLLELVSPEISLNGV